MIVIPTEASGGRDVQAHRIATRLAELYDDALRPSGLTIYQFGLLAFLYATQLDGWDRLSPDALADFIGTPPCVVARHLKLLEARGWVAEVVDPTEGQVVGVRITSEGRAHLRKAVPYWREAQRRAASMLDDRIERGGRIRHCAGDVARRARRSRDE
jgi:DNA-binding MarR family transcriptional regulator